MNKQEIMNELARKIATEGLIDSELYRDPYFSYDDRKWILDEAIRIMNPFNIKFGVEHLRLGAKVRVAGIMGMDDFTGKIYEICDVWSNGYQSFVLETTTPAHPDIGGNFGFNVQYVQQIVEQGKGPRCIEVLNAKDFEKRLQPHNKYRMDLKDRHELNSLLGHQNSSRMATCNDPREAVMIYLSGMRENGFVGVVDLDSLMCDPGFDSIIKLHYGSGPAFSFMSWNKNKLKKWVKKNVRRHLWSKAKKF